MSLATIILSWCYFTPNLFYCQEIIDDVDMEVITKISSATCLSFGKFLAKPYEGTTIIYLFERVRRVLGANLVFEE